jgi:hypothetical protein
MTANISAEGACQFVVVTIIFLIVPESCETLYVTLREDYR